VPRQVDDENIAAPHSHLIDETGGLIPFSTARADHRFGSPDQRPMRHHRSTGRPQSGSELLVRRCAHPQVVSIGHPAWSEPFGPDSRFSIQKSTPQALPGPGTGQVPARCRCPPRACPLLTGRSPTEPGIPLAPGRFGDAGRSVAVAARLASGWAARLHLGTIPSTGRQGVRASAAISSAGCWHSR